MNTDTIDLDLNGSTLRPTSGAFLTALAVLLVAGFAAVATLWGSAGEQASEEAAAPAGQLGAPATGNPGVAPDDSGPDKGGKTDTGGPYYETCADAYAKGVWDIKVGDPGYRAALDRDGDGYACEKDGEGPAPVVTTAPPGNHQTTTTAYPGTTVTTHQDTTTTHHQTTTTEYETTTTHKETTTTEKQITWLDKPRRGDIWFEPHPEGKEKAKVSFSWYHPDTKGAAPADAGYDGIWIVTPHGEKIELPYDATEYHSPHYWWGNKTWSVQYYTTTDGYGDSEPLKITAKIRFPMEEDHGGCVKPYPIGDGKDECLD